MEVLSGTGRESNKKTPVFSRRVITAGLVLATMSHATSAQESQINFGLSRLNLSDEPQFRVYDDNEIDFTQPVDISELDLKNDGEAKKSIMFSKEESVFLESEASVDIKINRCDTVKYVEDPQGRQEIENNSKSDMTKMLICQMGIRAAVEDRLGLTSSKSKSILDENGNAKMPKKKNKVLEGAKKIFKNRGVKGKW